MADAASKPSNAHYVFVAGGLSGIAEGVSIQPLELLKTRFQIHTGAPLQIIPTVREIIREGGIRQLYRGGLPEISGLVPRATAALSTLEFTQRQLRAANGGVLSITGAYISGAMSGVSEGVAFAPFQVIKVRLMAKEHLGRYHNTFDCLAKVVRSEGPQALFIGLGPTLWRNTIWNGLYYGTMLELGQRMGKLENEAAEVARDFVVGIGVGMLATCFNAPFDVVKSRFQSQLPGDKKYYWTLQSLYRIYREEGPRALYKGFLPKAIRLGVGQTIGLVLFRKLLKLFGAADHATPA